MANQSGYSGWVNLELSDAEKADAAMAVKDFSNNLQQLGLSEAVSKLKLEFSKASLTITQDEANRGAGHSLANGKPFFQMTLTAEGSMFKPTKAVEYAFYLSQAFAQNGGASMSVANPTVLTHEFAGTIKDKSQFLSQASVAIANYMNGQSANNNPHP